MNPWRSVEQYVKKNKLPVLEKFFRRPGVNPSLVNFGTFRRILVIRQHDQLGDFLLSTPVLRALREQFPQAHIAVLVRSYTADVAQHHEFINELIVLRERLAGWSFGRCRQFVRQVRGGFDLAIVLNTVSHSLTSDLLAHFSRSKYVLGSEHLRFPGCSRNFFYDMEAPYREQARHQTERNLDIVRYLGIDTQDRREVMHLLPEELAAGRQFLHEQGMADGDLVVALHIGAGKMRNRWPAERFAGLATMLHTEYAAKIVAMWGHREEKLGARLLSALDFDPIVAKGMRLRQLAAVIANSRILICNDTGVMHLAAATGTPLVSIFGPTNPGEWKPIGDRFLAVRSASHNSEDVSIEIVLDAIRNLVGAELAPRRPTVAHGVFDISEQVLEQYLDVLKKSGEE